MYCFPRTFYFDVRRPGIVNNREDVPSMQIQEMFVICTGKAQRFSQSFLLAACAEGKFLNLAVFWMCLCFHLPQNEIMFTTECVLHPKPAFFFQH